MPTIHYRKSDVEIRCLCITVVLFGVVSFRSVPRILSIFFGVKEWVPHFTSIINWTLRLGIGLLNLVTPIPEPWIAIMDHSIDIGVKKVLVVLRVRLGALMERGGAVTLADCQCIGISIHEKCSGENVAKDLKDIFQKAGSPIAIIKDGGSGLTRGIDLWRTEADKINVKVIEDIGHVVANAIKDQFAKTKLFNLFLALVNRCQRHLRQTSLAFLKPPKVRSKGRFQGIAVLVIWATKILEFYADTKSNPDFKTFRFSLMGLSRLKSFIQGFAQTIITSSQILKTLKCAGLNQTSYKECCDLLNLMPPNSPVKKRIQKWLDEHLHKHCLMGIGQTPLLVSSDIIESLFGKFKHIIERGSMLDMNRSVLILPTLCGTLNEKSIHEIITTTVHSDISNWDQINIPHTQNRRRRSFLKAMSSA